MGRDKATMPVDGAAMAARVAAVLRDVGCVPVVAIGGDPGALAALGLDVVADLHPGEGPLGGIVTALDALVDARAVVVVGCDMPWLSVAAVMAVITGLGEHEVAVAHGDRREPLCAAWRPSVLPLLRIRFDEGVRAVQRVLDECDSTAVDVDPASVRNVNSAADLGGGTRRGDG
jgi:molybdopterin-guanine dinucleotide biosynthesis protein A